MEKIVIIEYGAGNVRSVYNAVKRLGQNALITSDLKEIATADKVIFPGVGHALAAMEQIKVYGLDKLLPTLKVPLLGICLGMQLLAESSEEGPSQGLNCIDGRVVQMDGENSLGERLKVPHMGWNRVSHDGSPLFKGIESGTYFYFVHSYYLPTLESTIATTTYSDIFTAAVAKDNFYGCQFHPEKSSEQGQQLLKNFLTL